MTIFAYALRNWLVAMPFTSNPLRNLAFSAQGCTLLLGLVLWSMCASSSYSQNGPANSASPPPIGTQQQWMQNQARSPQQNDPAIVRPSGYSIQQPNAVPSGAVPSNAAQFTVLPNGQRVFSQPNPEQVTAPERNVAASAVQPASYTSSPSGSSPSIDGKKAKAPIELKSRSKESSGSVDKPKSTWAAGLSMFFSLLIVLSLFLLIAWLFRKSQPGAFVRLPTGVVQVMGRTAMAPRQQVYVVRFGNKLLLISHQPGQTQTLGEITDIDEVQRLAGMCEANQPNSVTHSFRDILRQVASGKPDQEPRASYRNRSAT
jgi:flagellar biogenesis protein FliO